MSKNTPRRELVEDAIMKILKYRVGAENGMTRADLLLALHQQGFMEMDPNLADLNDRQMRLVIESIRTHEAEGAFIIAIKNQAGDWVYCRAKDIQEFRKAIEPEFKRGVTVINRAREQVRRAYPELLGQLEY